MSFPRDRRAQSVVIGSVVLFGFLIAALSMYQVQVVPQQNAQTEFEHFQETQDQFTTLRNSISRGGQTNVEQYESVRLGIAYQARLFTINPPPPSGTLRTTEAYNISVGGNVVQTRFLEYRNGYNQLSIGSLRYDNSVVYLEGNTEGERVIYEDQNLVTGEGQVRVTALQNAFQASGTGRQSVELYPTENATFNDGDLIGTIEVGLPTRLDGSYWDSEIPESLWASPESSVNESAYPEHGDVYRLELTLNARDLKFNTVGINGAPRDTGSLRQNVGIGGDDSNNPDAIAIKKIDGFSADVAADEFTIKQVQIQDNDNDDDLYSVEYEVTDGSGTVVATRTDRDIDPAQYQPKDIVINTTEDVQTGEEYTLTVTAYDADGNFATDTRTTTT